MKKIVIVNHKGGVGKTTSSINISAGLAKKGNKVIIIDADPQANLTESFGIFDPIKDLYLSFSKGEPLPIIEVKKNLSIVPNSLNFSGIELEIAGRMPREIILKELMAGLDKTYDYCIIDCPPSLGLITLNALVAADEVYIPMEAEFLAYRGIDSIVGIITLVKKHFNPRLMIKGVFFTKYNEQRILTKEIKNQIKGYFGDNLMKTVIRVNVALAEAQSSGKDIFEYDPKSNGAKDYMCLVNEISKK
ncbi:MAG TPA: ParA family protein [Bacteroidales bacterium]|nr:ParA family protein [Bacteroidales bacterium]